MDFSSFSSFKRSVIYFLQLFIIFFAFFISVYHVSKPFSTFFRSFRCSSLSAVVHHCFISSYFSSLLPFFIISEASNLYIYIILIIQPSWCFFFMTSRDFSVRTVFASETRSRVRRPSIPGPTPKIKKNTKATTMASNILLLNPCQPLHRIYTDLKP